MAGLRKAAVARDGAAEARVFEIMEDDGVDWLTVDWLTVG